MHCCCAQGSGFSEAIAGLEAELKSMKAAHEKLTKDNKGCYNQIRAKDKELGAAKVQLERARAILVENKARNHPTFSSDRVPSTHSKEIHIQDVMAVG